MTSEASSRGGRQVFSVSEGGSLYKLCRQICRILDLTMGLRLGRRLLEGTQKVLDLVTQPTSLGMNGLAEVGSQQGEVCAP